MVYGWGSEQFPRYNTFYEMKGVGHATGGPLWDPWSMSLNAPHHKEQEYIWFMGEDLNGFLMRLIIRNKNIYGLWVGI